MQATITRDREAQRVRSSGSKDLYDAIFSPNSKCRQTPIAEEFLRENIEITLRFPQTQAVIGIHTAKFMVDAIIAGRTEELQSFVRDLGAEDPRDCGLNLEALSKYVADIYADKIRFVARKVQPADYQSLFQHEFRTAMEMLGDHLRTLDSEQNCREQNKRFDLLRDLESDMSFFTDNISIRALASFPASFLQELSDIYQTYIDRMSGNKAIKKAKAAMFQALRDGGSSLDPAAVAALKAYRLTVREEGFSIIKNLLEPSQVLRPPTQNGTAAPNTHTTAAPVGRS